MLASMPIQLACTSRGLLGPSKKAAAGFVRILKGSLGTSATLSAASRACLLGLKRTEPASSPACMILV